MSMMQNHVGVDMVKNWIGAHELETGLNQRVKTTSRSLKHLTHSHTNKLIAFETSGRYERLPNGSVRQGPFPIAALLFGPYASLSF